MSKESKRKARHRKEARRREQARIAALEITPAHARLNEMHEQFEADRANVSARPVHRPLNAMSQAPGSAILVAVPALPVSSESRCPHGKSRSEYCYSCNPDAYRYNFGDSQSD